MLYNPAEHHDEQKSTPDDVKQKSNTSVYENVKGIVKSFLKRNQKETIL